MSVERSRTPVYKERTLRWRPDQRICPKCRSSLVVEERAVTVGGIDEVVLWVPSRRLCLQGCHLTLSDFPDGDLD